MSIVTKLLSASNRRISRQRPSTLLLNSRLQQHQCSLLHISIEETPNPTSMKFVPKNRLVIEVEDGGKEDTCWSFRNAVHCVDDVREGAPLAADILDLENVNEVMLTSNSITVNIKHVSEWTSTQPIVVEIIQEAYDAQVFNPFSIIENAELAKKVGTTGSNVTWEPDSIESEIEEHLEANIRPFVKQDGGDIYLVGVEPVDDSRSASGDDAQSLVVKVQMIGACSGCPSSAVTLHGRVETMLKHYFPEISSVIQVEDESIFAELDAQPKTTIEEHIQILTKQGEDSSIVWHANSNKNQEEEGKPNHSKMRKSSATNTNNNGKRFFTTSRSSSSSSNPNQNSKNTNNPPPDNARFSVLFPSPLWHANLLKSKKAHRGKGRSMGSSGILDERINMKVKEKIMEIFQGRAFQSTENNGIVNQYTAAGYDERMVKNNEFFQYQIDTMHKDNFHVGANAQNKIENLPYPGTNSLLWSKDYSTSKEMKILVNKFRDGCIWFLHDSFGIDINQATSFVHSKQLLVWGSVHGQGSGHPYHIHSDGVLSGVYYANLPPGSGSIKFCDPRGVNPFQPLHQENAMPPFHQEHSMRPIVGDMIVFPSWLPHAVEPCKDLASFGMGQNYRISVSFNLLGTWDDLPNCAINLHAEKKSLGNKVAGTVEKDKTFARYLKREHDIVVSAQKRDNYKSTITDDAVEVVDDTQDFAALLAAKFGKNKLTYGKRPDGMPERPSKK